MEPTVNQQLAIDTDNCNILVSAAAGSGKTSVLVERIVRRIAGEGPDGTAVEPMDIDRRLIMTFTNAAAAEMRERIRKAIEKRAETGDPNLARQSILVHNAMITTIHGFCKSVITDHFEEISLDPNFRVADENECKLIMQDALDECMEAAYEEGDEGFLEAVECFSNPKNDEGLAGLIIPLYRFIIANPDPGGFLRQCCRAYNYDTYGEFEASDFVTRVKDHIVSELKGAKEAIDAAMSLVDDYEDLKAYRTHLEAYMPAFEKTDSLDKIRASISSLDIPRLASIRSDKLDEASREAAADIKRLRDEAKDRLAKIADMLKFDLKTSYEQMKTAAKPLEAICRLVTAFMLIYEDKKRDAGIIDFNDMEHMAVAILQNPDIAAGYREHYEEIYVDEYQDSNLTQEMLVSLICRKDPGNVFMVGDVKQSIYRFRHARPDLFIDKFNTYTDAPGPDRRILLNDNFRSRKEVVDAVNEVFARIMRADFCGIEYDDDAKLSFGAGYYENDSPCGSDTYRTEIIIGTSPEELPKEEYEAGIIAGRIQTMIREGFLIFDKESGSLRPVSYRDFTILARSIRKTEPAFREVFAGAGIPLAVTGREGYFKTEEVQTALAFLSAVDNPLCDIPLVTLATSPVCSLTDTDLARISALAGQKLCMYDRIRTALGIDDITDELRGKCTNLLEIIDRYRSMSAYTPVYGILADFIDNEYGDHVKCMPKGMQRTANLAMLLKKAEDFDRTNFKGLYSFVRYMDQIQKYEIDEGEAGAASDNDDVVRLMTMHASKGLEFPVCILTGLEKRRNTLDESGKLIWNHTTGFGSDFTDLDRRVTGVTLPKIMVREDNRREGIAEEMRLLYVAMTRARDKLIMVGCDKEDTFAEGHKSVDNCLSYLDMLKAAHGKEGFKHTDISYVSVKDVMDAAFEEKIVREASADDILDTVRRYAGNTTKNLPQYMSRLSFKYPHPVNPDLHAKLSVSELKHRAIEEEISRGLELAPEGEQLFGETEPDRYIPAFMRAEGETEKGGTFYGTAFHRIMELWDYSKDNISAEDVTEFADKMRSLHRMNKDQTNAIRPDDVAVFLNSALATRMRTAHQAQKLFREQPFVIGVPDSEIYPDGPECKETVLVQGIIDAYFVEDDEITIVDYKTDNVTDESMLTGRYRAQLEYYGRALSQITGKHVRSLIIYSTRMRKSIDLMQTD